MLLSYKKITAHFSNSHFLFISFIFISLLSMITQSMSRGGRWDMYEAIAMGDRMTGAFGYSTGVVDAFKPSTPYFPGSSFLSYSVDFLFSGYVVEIMHAIAIACIFLIQFLLYNVYKSLGGTFTLLKYLSISIAISMTVLLPWIHYALEFKPDTIGLVFFISAFLLVQNKKNNLLTSTGIFFCIALSIFFKQQLVAPIAGLFIGTLLLDIDIKLKLQKLFLIAAGTIASILVILTISGAFYYSILSHVGRGHINFFSERANIVILIFIIISAIYASIKYKINSRTLKSFYHSQHLPYFFSAGLWLVAGIAGAINIGGNAGNTAVGIVLFLPLIILIYTSPTKTINRIIFFLLIISVAYILHLGWFKKYEKRINVDNAITRELADRNINSVLISGDSYMAIRENKIDQISEIDTWVHIKNGINKHDVPATASELIELLKPEAIICAQRCIVFKAYGITPDLLGYIEIPLGKNKTKDIFYVRR